MKDNSIFRGNASLKASGVTLEFSKEKVEELTKCFHDPVYFIKNYVKIIHIDRGVVPFELYPFQEEMVRLILGKRHVIMTLPRQSGKCVAHCEKIRIRNKETGSEYELTMGDFFQWQRFRNCARELLEKHNLSDTL